MVKRTPRAYQRKERIVLFQPVDPAAEKLPAIVVRVVDGETVNLRVFQDSPYTDEWRTNVHHGPARHLELVRASVMVYGFMTRSFLHSTEHAR